MNDIKMIHGIDSLYYFCESNENYDNLFLEILDQMEEKKGIFEKKDIEYQNSDIYITIEDTPLYFLGCAEGFYWFKDLNEFFKIGFKDKTKNRGLNDIRIQLLGVGIYTIGIKSLIEFINTKLLKSYTTGYNPITRADLNCFIQYDFSFLTKEMFVTRKRKYATVSEIGTSKSTQTLYIGSKPFFLRMYNKKEELKKSSKKDMMYEYFLNNSFNLDDEIFNIEFEMHRTFLKQYNILTVDDILQNAQKLFRASMENIKLIDLDSISTKDKEHNKYKAEIHPLWEHIKLSYNLKDFLQTALPLDRVQRKVSIYDDMKFKTEIIAVLRRAFINNLIVEPEHLDVYYFEAKQSLIKTTKKEFKPLYETLENYINIDGKKEKARLLDDNTIIKPVNVVSVNTLSDYDLTIYLNKLTKNKGLSKHDNNLYSVAYSEAVKRGLLS